VLLHLLHHLQVGVAVHLLLHLLLPVMAVLRLLHPGEFLQSQQVVAVVPHLLCHLHLIHHHL
jgi:hypothetical protein